MRKQFEKCLRKLLETDEGQVFHERIFESATKYPSSRALEGAEVNPF